MILHKALAFTMHVLIEFVVPTNGKKCPSTATRPLLSFQKLVFRFILDYCSVLSSCEKSFVFHMSW